MKKLLFYLIVGIAISCDSNSSFHKEEIDTTLKSKQEQTAIKKEPIYLSTYTSFKREDGEMGMKTELSKVTEEYFEIDLMAMGDKKTHQAQKDLEKLTSLETLHSVSIAITNEKSDPISFKSSTEFLNFMDAHGYEMKDQQKLKFGISYTFKKKQFN
jgi:hypothetical protein